MALTAEQIRNMKVGISGERASTDELIEMARSMGLNGSEAFTLVTVAMNTLFELLAQKAEACDEYDPPSPKYT